MATLLVNFRVQWNAPNHGHEVINGASVVWYFVIIH